jgi:hypothetical protein
VADIIGAPGMHRGDDLFGVDALQVDRHRAEIRMVELALDAVERHAFARELDGVDVAQLMRRTRGSRLGWARGRFFAALQPCALAP